MATGVARMSASRDPRVRYREAPTYLGQARIRSYERWRGMTTRAGSADSGTFTFQVEGGGAIPTSALQLRVEKVAFHHIAPYLIDLHYLGRRSSIPKVSYAVFFGWRCVGCLVYGQPVARLEDQRTTLELNRFWLADECPKNSESRLLGVTTRLLKRDAPHIKRVIAYSDSAMGHKGTIYKASGWSAQPGRLDTWERANRVRRNPKVMGVKTKWEKVLS
jgi:hypothetical protein